MGCAIGCTAITVVLIVFGTVGYLYIHEMFRGVGQAEESYQALVERHGDISQFTPSPDGSIPARRVELFLSVRESLIAPQTRLEAVFSGFPPGEMMRDDSFFNAVRIMKALADMIPPIIE